MDDNELMRAVIGKEIDRQIAEQKEELMETITQGIEETDSMEMACAKTAVNGVVATAKICAVMTARMLFDAGVWQPKDEDELRRSLFSVVKSDNAPEHSTEQAK